jgi:hypothetical protein
MLIRFRLFGGLAARLAVPRPPVPAMPGLWIFLRPSACRVDRGGPSVVKCGVYPIYDLCLLMHLPRLETSGALASPDLMCGILMAARATPCSVKEGMG